MSKTLTDKEGMKALLEGKKLIKSFWVEDNFNYIFFDSNGKLVNQYGVGYDFDGCSDYIIYEEPKPKKQVWQWRVKPYNSPITWSVCPDLFTEEGAKEAFNSLRYEKHAGPFEVSE